MKYSDIHKQAENLKVAASKTIDREICAYFSEPKIKRKKGSRSKLIKELVDTAILIAKYRDMFLDQRTGEKLSGSNCHGSHVVPVSHGNILKWDPENIITLSYHNHLHWWHKNPLESAEWFKNKFPDRYKYIMERKNTIVKYTESDLREELIRLKSILSLAPSKVCCQPF
jgi:5-methylcytosine-specific restriction endonuclease McrA